MIRRHFSIKYFFPYFSKLVIIYITSIAFDPPARYKAYRKIKVKKTRHSLPLNKRNNPETIIEGAETRKEFLPSCRRRWRSSWLRIPGKSLLFRALFLLFRHTHLQPPATKCERALPSFSPGTQLHRILEFLRSRARVSRYVQGAKFAALISYTRENCKFSVQSAERRRKERDAPEIRTGGSLRMPMRGGARMRMQLGCRALRRNVWHATLRGAAGMREREI